MSYTANANRYTLMQYRPAGASGLQLPVISFGLWQNFGSSAQRSTMEELLFTAFDAGITYFDLANNYGPVAGSAEINFGQILKQDLSAYRDQMIIASKAGYTMWEGPYGDFGSRKYLIASLEQSLQRMGLDYVDIFYHHRMDPNTPLEETMTALADIVRQGKALYVGLSNYDGVTMTAASQLLKELRCPFVVNQNRYSMLSRDIETNGLQQACTREKKGIVAFSPLAQGLLSEKYLGDVPQDSRMMGDSISLKPEALTSEILSKLKALHPIAINRGQTLSQMALSYLLNQDNVTSVLVGASRVSQLQENIASLNNLEFTPEEMAQIQNIL